MTLAHSCSRNPCGECWKVEGGVSRITVLPPPGCHRLDRSDAERNAQARVVHKLRSLAAAEVTTRVSPTLVLFYSSPLHGVSSPLLGTCLLHFRTCLVFLLRSTLRPLRPLLCSALLYSALPLQPQQQPAAVPQGKGGLFLPPRQCLSS